MSRGSCSSRCSRRCSTGCLTTAAISRAPCTIETIGVIQGMQHLPASFTPGRRLGPGIDETLEKLQRVCDEQGIARPITEYKEAAVIGD